MNCSYNISIGHWPDHTKPKPFLVGWLVFLVVRSVRPSFCWYLHVLIFSFRICRYNSKLIVQSMMESCHGEHSAQEVHALIPPPCFTEGIKFLSRNAVLQTKYFSFKTKGFLLVSYIYSGLLTMVTMVLNFQWISGVQTFQRFLN